jgi:hypothetical protein
VNRSLRCIALVLCHINYFFSNVLQYLTLTGYELFHTKIN